MDKEEVKETPNSLLNNSQMIKACKIKLYPNQAQIQQINKTIGCCRFLYNEMLNERIEKYKAGDKSKGRTEKEIKEEFPFLKEASSRALQQSRIDLDSAYKNFFRRVKEKKWKVGFPKFKSKRKNKESYREPQVDNCIRADKNHITLLKLGSVKFRGNIIGDIRSITVQKQKDGTYTASVLVEAPEPQGTNRKGSIGVDLWIKHFVITSNGEFYKNIDLDNRKIKRAQQHLSRKEKGSNRRENAIRKLNRAYAKQNNRQTHFQWHLVRDIISENQAIVVESLNIKGMMQNWRISSAFQRVSLSSFVTKLKQKAEILGVEIIEADRFFPSSKLCSCCGNKKQDLSLSERAYSCEKCWTVIDRDFNASLNLKALSSEYGDYSRGENVRLIEKTFDFNISNFRWNDYSGM